MWGALYDYLHSQNLPVGELRVRVLSLSMRVQRLSAQLSHSIGCWLEILEQSQ